MKGKEREKTKKERGKEGTKGKGRNTEFKSV
jgi:hypothetical protein